MKKIIILIFLVFPFTGFSEEYICSGKKGERIETKIYERNIDHFLYTTKNWKFTILEENYKHIMLGRINFWNYDKVTTLFLTIINKETNEFSERYVESNNKRTLTLFGKCLVRN